MKTLSHCAVSKDCRNAIRAGIAVAGGRVRDASLHWEHSPMWLVERMFPHEVIAGCRVGFSYSRRISDFYHYTVMKGVRLRIVDWTALNMLPPAEEYTQQVPELESFCKKAIDIHLRYFEVSHVMEWLLFNCNNGATVIDYCPWVRSVVDAGWGKTLARGKITSPPNIGPILPRIREVNTLMSTALLAPPAEPKKDKNIILEFISSVTMAKFTMVL